MCCSKRQTRYSSTPSTSTSTPPPSSIPFSDCYASSPCHRQHCGRDICSVQQPRPMGCCGSRRRQQRQQRRRLGCQVEGMDGSFSHGYAPQYSPQQQQHTRGRGPIGGLIMLGGWAVKKGVEAVERKRAEKRAAREEKAVRGGGGGVGEGEEKKMGFGGESESGSDDDGEEDEDEGMMITRRMGRMELPSYESAMGIKA